MNRNSVVVMLGTLGMLFGLANKSLTMVEKIPITIFCFVIIMIGALAGSPIIESLSPPGGVEEDTDFDDGY